MTAAAPLAKVFRGPFLESEHVGHAIVMHPDGTVAEVLGDPSLVVLPRSSVKMIQALPLLETGAGAALDTRRLAIACASHSGEAMHMDLVTDWLGEMGLDEDDLACGPEPSRWPPQLHADIREGRAPRRACDNCSGKHTGFLCLNRHLGADKRHYAEPDHPVQRTVREVFEEVTGEPSPGYGVDGCSAPNFATTMTGLARAMAAFAGATGSDSRGAAMVRLREAMMAHPELVAGTGRACTELMRAAGGRAAVKTGAEGVYTAILPERRLGIAVKVADGATRAAEAAIAALLVRHGAIEADHPAARKYMDQPLQSRAGAVVGAVRAAETLAQANSDRA